MLKGRTFWQLLSTYKKNGNMVKVKLNDQSTVVGKVMELKKDCVCMISDKNPGYGYVIPLRAISCLVVKS